MHGVKRISGYQFAAFRILFGAYLVVHLAGLIPYGAELFSREGMVPEARLNFTYGILPNPLEPWGSPGAVAALLWGMLLLSACYALGLGRRIAGVLLWYGWACLFNRNNLISNPSIPYVGMLLALSALVPPREPLSLRFGPSREAWVFPAGVYWTAWFLMALGYTFSGYAKCLSPSWVDGTAMLHVVQNPLARPGPFRDLFLQLPDWAIRLQTWTALALELAFLPMSLARATRKAAWLAMAAMHLAILLVVDFADLSLGMLLLHLFTFDPEWLPPRKPPLPCLVLFDGVCGLCDRTVKLLLAEDTLGMLRFAPLQGASAREVAERHPELKSQGESILLVEGHGTPGESVCAKSEAALRICDRLGGFWRVVSWLRLVPLALRDRVYGWVARNRYAWFGRYSECVLPSPDVRVRFLP